MYFEEVDDISDDDLEAASDYYERLLNYTLPQKQAEKIALEQYGVVLEASLLNRIMEEYACSSRSIDACVSNRLRMAGLV